MEALSIFAAVLVVVLAVAARATWRERRAEMRWQLSLAVAVASWATVWGLTLLLAWLVDPGGEEWSWWWLTVPPALGFATGLARPALPALPLASAATVVAVYLLAMLGLGVWAAQCWDCSSGGHDAWTRAGGYAIFGYVLGLIVVFMLLAIGVGWLFSWFLPARSGPRSRKAEDVVHSG